MEQCISYLIAHIVQALAEDHRSAIMGIQVEVISSRLFLIGQVESDSRKRAVEEVVRELAPEGMEVVNQLWITTYDRPPAQPEHLR